MEKKNGKKSQKRLVIIITALIAVIAVIYALTDFITDILWFRQLGYLDVYFKEITTKLLLGAPMFIVAGGLSYLLLTVLRKNFYKSNSMEAAKLSPKKLKLTALAISGLCSLVFTIGVINDHWFEILEFINSSSFGVADPLFGKDVSFYVFRLEFLETLSRSATGFIIGLLVITAVYYMVLLVSSDPSAMSGVASAASAGPDGVYEFEAEPAGSHEEGFPRINFDFSKYENSDLKKRLRSIVNVAQSELSLLAVLFFLSVALKYWLAQYDLLYGGTGACYGAGYTDINVTLNVYRAMMIFSVAAAVLIPLALKKRSIKLGAVAPALMVVVLVLGTVASGAVQNLIVAPDELDKESPYLQNNITYTRLAYDLADIRVEDYSAAGTLTKTDVLDNMETFSNIRINDFDPAKQFYNQTQSIRSYYSFNDVDVDRYYVNGEYTQVFLAAREIDSDRIEDNWLIKHLKYTHGYGLTLSRVDRVTASGQPAMMIDSIPPVSDVAEIQIDRPEIYYGETTNSYIITNTREDEFDYPSGESNVYCDYEGEGGIPLNFFNRLLFAIREGNLQILISTNINSQSRIHIARNIVQRVQSIAPFFYYDDDPCIIAADGQLYWMMSAYTTSEYYPYSEPFQAGSEMNYIRNSVKVVVNAYDGSVDFYMVDDSDPIALTLGKIYPGLLKPLSDMPAGLRQHVLYPNTLFNIQAGVYQKYHMTDVAVFYQSEDLWSVSNEFYGQSTTRMTPNYFIMKLPGETEAEFVSTIPYTPSGKSNMTGILMARNDGENYGEIVLYRMPKDRIIYGPEQIEAQINQDAEITKEFSLWNNSGSSYLRGNMYAIPVNDTILYVEPIYLVSSAASLPEVKRVIVYYGSELAYASTLAEALDEIFGEGTGAPLSEPNPIEAGHQAAAAIRSGASVTPAQPQQPDDTQSVVVDVDPQTASLAVQALMLYDEAQMSLKNGDWAGYGEKMAELEALLQQMSEGAELPAPEEPDGSAETDAAPEEGADPAAAGQNTDQDTTPDTDETIDNAD